MRRKPAVLGSHRAVVPKKLVVGITALVLKSDSMLESPGEFFKKKKYQGIGLTSRNAAFIGLCDTT